MNSSVDASCRFMYPSVETRKPLYSWPHLSLTITGLPVRLFRKGLGFMGMAPAILVAKVVVGLETGENELV